MREAAALHLVERELAGARLLGELAELGGELEHALLVDVADDRHQQAAIGVDGDADVEVLLEDQRLAGHVDRRVDLRERLERRGRDLERHRRHRQLALRLRLEALAELLAQRLEIGDVGLVVLRDVRHAGSTSWPCARPSCGGWRASAGARSRPTCEKSGSGAAGSAAAAARLRGDDLLAVGEDVVGRDAAAGAGAAHRVDVEAELPREAADRRRRGRGGRLSGAVAGAGAQPRQQRPRAAREVDELARSAALRPGVAGLAAEARPAAAAPGRRRGRGVRGDLLGAGLGRRGAAGAPRRSTAWPIVTLSPALTLISVTVPATDDGTSIVALSVSSSSTPLGSPPRPASSPGRRRHGQRGAAATSPAPAIDVQHDLPTSPCRRS